jgi:CheY-like chemotaxis protein
MPSQSPITPPPGIRVLLVDDEPAMRDILGALLRHYGFTVETATDGYDALIKLGPQLDTADIVVTDNQMPRMDGLTLIRSLREANYGGKIVVFSSSLTAEKARKLGELGVHGVVEKGQSGTAIVAEIRRILA